MASRRHHLVNCFKECTRGVDFAPFAPFAPFAHPSCAALLSDRTMLAGPWSKKHDPGAMCHAIPHGISLGLQNSAEFVQPKSRNLIWQGSVSPKTHHIPIIAGSYFLCTMREEPPFFPTAA